MRPICLFVIFVALLGLGLWGPKMVAAQYTPTLATELPVQGDVHDGDIVSLAASGYVLSSVAYDTAVYGVVNASPAASFKTQVTGKTYPVVTVGEVPVRVSTQNGKISRGDFVTTSKVAGVGQKADTYGFVVGVALQDFTNSDPKAVDTILVSVSPRFATITNAKPINLLQNIRNVLSAPFLTPLTSLRYLLAVIVTGIAFAIGFTYFGRIVRRGIEALGRNPLAATVINIGIIYSFFMTVIIIASGLILAYLILML